MVKQNSKIITQFDTAELCKCGDSNAKKMYILVACEESQEVCKAFRLKGHFAFSCDILDCSGGFPQWHIKSDVSSLLNGYQNFYTSDGLFHCFQRKWDMIIAFPPCTYLCNTGNKHFNIDVYGSRAVERLYMRELGFKFFMSIANADCDKIVIENPVGYCNTHFRKPDQIIEPWMFGHPYTKKTCLWLKGVDCLIPDITIKPPTTSYAFCTMFHSNGKTISWSSELSKKLRSKTFSGVAAAMASQWG